MRSELPRSDVLGTRLREAGRPRGAPVVALVALAALGAGCHLAHERTGPGGDASVSSPEASTCPSPTGGGCRAWELAGDPIDLVTLGPGDIDVVFGSAIARPCGVLAGWSISHTESASVDVRYETRLADWSGAPTAAIEEHRGPGAMAGSLLLAAGPGGVGALLGNPRCEFRLFDEAGRELGVVGSETASATCVGLAATPTGYSWLEDLGGVLSFDSADVHGSIFVGLVTHEGRSLAGRAMLDDGSFLVSSFAEDLATARYRSWLERFHPEDISAPGPAFEIGENAVSLLVSPNAAGALAAWMTAQPGGLPLRVQPVDRDGRPFGTARDVEASGALYGHALTTTPDGDALYAWLEWHSGAASEWLLRVQALAPDGTPRGAATTVPVPAGARPHAVLVEPTGGRALAMLETDDAISALPLRCAR